MTIELRGWPNSGSVLGTSANVSGWRWRKFVRIAAGPLANLLIFLVAVNVLMGSRHNEADLIHHISPWLALAAANFALILQSLWGRDMWTINGRVPCDGRQLFRLLFKPQPATDVRRREYFHAKSAFLFRREDRLPLIKLVKEGLEEFPTDLHLQVMLAVTQLDLGDYELSREAFRELLIEYSQQDAQRAIIANNLAWTDLLLARPDLLDEADTASAEAYSLTPWTPCIQGTRGWLLVERGQVDEGAALLEKALEGVDTPSHKASILCNLALVEVRRGLPAAANALFNKARRLNPHCELLARTQRMLSEAVETHAQA